tara:strand:+ start:102 stop:2198 length:2097 start_codon:yes stop_codon:yes gene_type:complete
MSTLQPTTTQTVQNLYISSASLLGPLNTTKCIVIETPSKSSRGEIIYTSDALIFLQAISLHHPASILVRDIVSSTRKMMGSGSRTTICWMCQLITLSQQWKHKGVSIRTLSSQMHRATNICVASFDLISLQPNLNDSNFLYQLATTLQHSDPTLETWNEGGRRREAETEEGNKILQPYPNLCMPMRIAMHTIQHLLQHTTPGHRLDFSLINVNTIGGIASSFSCSNLGVQMEVLMSDAQRCDRVFGSKTLLHRVQGIVLIDGDCIYQDNSKMCTKFGISTTTVLKNATELYQEYKHGGVKLQVLDQLVEILCNCFNHKPGLVLVCGKVAPHVLQKCETKNILVVSHVKYGDLEAVSRINGAELIGDPWSCTVDDVGTAIQLETKIRGWMAPEDAPSIETNRSSYSGADANSTTRHRMVHLVIRPIAMQFVNEMERDKVGSGSGRSGSGRSGGSSSGGSDLLIEIPITVSLCSRIPALLDDAGVRFWKYMHRLRTALGLKGMDESDENGQDCIDPTTNDVYTLLPGGGLPEAVAIVALRHAAAAAASTVQTNACSSMETTTTLTPTTAAAAGAAAAAAIGTLTDADVFLGYAQVLHEHMLQVMMNSGLLLEESLSLIQKYLKQIDQIIGTIIQNSKEITASETKEQVQNIRHLLPQPIFVRAFNSKQVTMDVKCVKIEAIKAATRAAVILNNVEFLLKN